MLRLKRFPFGFDCHQRFEGKRIDQRQGSAVTSIAPCDEGHELRLARWLGASEQFRQGHAAKANPRFRPTSDAVNINHLLAQRKSGIDWSSDSSMVE